MELLTHGGQRIEIGNRRDDYYLVDYDGFANTSLTPISRRGAFQIGETLLNVAPNGKTLIIECIVSGATRTEYLERRNALARACYIEPVVNGETIQPVRLLYRREGLQPVQLFVVPEGAPSFDERGPNAGRCVLELFAFDPYWDLTRDTVLRMGPDTVGLEYENEYELEYPSFREQEISNEGDVKVFPTFRLFGAFTTGRIMNLTYGETLEVTGRVESNEYVEIVTGYGKKSITLVNRGTRQRQDIISRMNPLLSEFWSLRRGTQTIRFEADTSLGSSMRVTWRERKAGV